ncbi:RNA polymerase sigma-70 factor [Carboxylicivirga sediminis]|uniref:RNA polymerase sigma-70 factor n=2 Tax=Carboxylicivirga sediminis TaxID=2006564 RepID=A0A941IXH2_9BACT|nr:RNA polymerase sigma-70 factor [Carboxylicivirga sediminis]
MKLRFILCFTCGLRIFEAIRESMNPSEKIILQAIKNGEVTIYKELFSKYSKSLFYYACKFIDEDEARDIVQDVFMAIWTQRSSLEINTSLNSYLFGITRNKCLKHLQRKERTTDSDQLSIKEVQHYEMQNDAISSLIEKELNDKYEAALQQLPPKCLEVFLMSRRMDLKNKEIAAQLDISEKAVEKHISKALRHLRKELKDYLPLLYYLGQFWG